MTEVDVSKEIAEANARLPVVIGDREMPLDITIRSIALSVAQRHCGDTTVKDGAMYTALKLDNKLGGPLTTHDVVRAALIFEMYLWGKWSQGLAGKAMEMVNEEIEGAIKRGEFDKTIDELKDEPPTRTHSGEAE